jgi:hypothetical protein
VNPFGRQYITRWGEPEHDGLTPAHLEGAVRLGWLTREQVDALLADEGDVTA